ncbi:hypothetical protein RRG08_036485 [Elysia crispata]|uniref:Uncharacterized protein n=1 Tax=Elysia crispata TaxID=231223 RepID=A0AAE0ZL34_9GAST|nr:hypothetical protein RRG08_036485 [Elysia crispata]
MSGDAGSDRLSQPILAVPAARGVVITTVAGFQWSQATSICHANFRSECYVQLVLGVTCDQVPHSVALSDFDLSVIE